MLRSVVFVVAAGVALVAAGAVLAQSSDKEKIARTAAGNARAATEVLHRGDFGKGWSGGPTKPVLNSPEPCSYRPKQSDLVVVGAAETAWGKPGSEIDSEAQVLRTAAMVRRDWQRTVLAPQVLACLRQGLEKVIGSSGKVTSIRRVAFPHVATRTMAFRFLAKINSGDRLVPFESDIVALGAGRNELSLVLSAAGAGRAPLRADTLRLARVLAHRMHS
jgi:hypothetical protein